MVSMRIAEAVERAERAELRGDAEKALERFVEARRLMQKNPSVIVQEHSLLEITEKIEAILGEIEH